MSQEYTKSGPVPYCHARARYVGPTPEHGRPWPQSVGLARYVSTEPDSDVEFEPSGREPDDQDSYVLPRAHVQFLDE